MALVLYKMTVKHKKVQTTRFIKSLNDHMIISNLLRLFFFLILT